MTLPAVALYCALAAGCEDAEGLPNAYGECILICFEDGDYCDFKLKLNAKPLPYWPPVFSQDNPYK